MGFSIYTICNDIVSLQHSSMKKQLFTALFLLPIISLSAQTTFKCGWDTYKARMVIHEYTYSYNFKDSVHLYLADSTRIYISSDSSAILSIDYPFHDNIKYKVANYYNSSKKLIRTEEYKDDAMQTMKEYRYDDKNRKIFQSEDNKVNGNNYKKQYDYSTDKKTGESVIHEASYFNGRIEFYTRSYYDKNSVLYKEVRLNDNNKDVIHEEKFKYGENGKVKERSVFFNEFKVTKTFPETAGEQPVKCYKAMAVNIPEKATLGGKISFLKKLLTKNQAMLLDPDCHEFEYKFTNSDCEVIVSTTKTNGVKQVIYRYKERVPF